jgi:hypothetical protein
MATTEFPPDVGEPLLGPVGTPALDEENRWRCESPSPLCTQTVCSGSQVRGESRSSKTSSKSPYSTNPANPGRIQPLEKTGTRRCPGSSQAHAPSWHSGGRRFDPVQLHHYRRPRATLRWNRAASHIANLLRSVTSRRLFAMCLRGSGKPSTAAGHRRNRKHRRLAMTLLDRSGARQRRFGGASPRLDARSIASGAKRREAIPFSSTIRLRPAKRCALDDATARFLGRRERN